MLLRDRGYEYNLSLTESYVDSWLDAGERLTELGHATYKRTVAQCVADLDATNEND